MAGMDAIEQMRGDIADLKARVAALEAKVNPPPAPDAPEDDSNPRGGAAT